MRASFVRALFARRNSDAAPATVSQRRGSDATVSRREGDPLAVCTRRRPRRARRPARMGRGRPSAFANIDQSPGARRRIEGISMTVVRTALRRLPLRAARFSVLLSFARAAADCRRRRRNHRARHAHGDAGRTSHRRRSKSSSSPPSTRANPAFPRICCAVRRGLRSASPAASAASPKCGCAARKPTTCW